MIRISQKVSIPESEVVLTAIRSSGAGGQHVNKVSTAVHLRFDIFASSLPDRYKVRLACFPDRRITREGVVVIKAGRFRSREKNREEALLRLAEIIRSSMVSHKERRPTAPSAGSRRRRLDQKAKRGRVKALRAKVEP